MILEGFKLSIERMSEFFTLRVDGYDEHMINNVEGCKEGYVKMAELLPQDADEILDLGCGTGVELDEIFKIKPNIHVTGIDLTEAMLDKLKQKHKDKNTSRKQYRMMAYHSFRTGRDFLPSLESRNLRHIRKGLYRIH